MSTETQSQSDYQSVEELIEEAQVLYDRHQCQDAALFWMSAYRIFRKRERKAGLPQTEFDKLAYGAIVASLKASGKLILLWAEKKSVNFTDKGFTCSDLRASLEALALDENHVEFPPSEKENEELNRIFGIQEPASA